MQLQFTKEIIQPDNPLHQGYLESDRLYQVFDDKKLIGNFLCSSNEAYFEVRDSKYKIVINKKFWNDSEYKIYQDATNLLIGEYYIPVIKPFGKEYNTLKLNNSLLNFEEIKRYKRFNILKPSTWKNINNKNFTLKISNAEHEVIYRLQINSKSIIDFSNAEFSPATGSIEYSPQSLLLSFAGLFLVEHFCSELDKYSS